MAWINSYGCSTAAGPSTTDLWQALLDGEDLVTPYPEMTGVHAFLFPGPRPRSVRELLLEQLRNAFAQAAVGARLGDDYGLILASTKGISNDFVWSDENASFESDPLTPLLNAFVDAEGLRPKRALCVSNACSSALGALALAEMWLARGISQVVVLAADAVTPFVIKGFQALKLMTEDRPRPFDRRRSGFLLGEGAACLILSKERRLDSVHLNRVGLDTEGSVVTRPGPSSASLARAAHALEAEHLPDVIVAHGTGTLINDETEDQAFLRLFGAGAPFATGTKWCIGHTLGASAAIDVIMACEALKQRRVFALMTTQQVDPALHPRYILNRAHDLRIERVLVSSLGFGGMHAMAVVESAAAAEGSKR